MWVISSVPTNNRSITDRVILGFYWVLAFLPFLLCVEELGEKCCRWEFNENPLVIDHSPGTIAILITTNKIRLFQLNIEVITAKEDKFVIWTIDVLNRIGLAMSTAGSLIM
jgi:hypothetical protein